MITSLLSPKIKPFPLTFSVLHIILFNKSALFVSFGYIYVKSDFFKVFSFVISIPTIKFKGIKTEISWLLFIIIPLGFIIRKESTK